MARSLTYTSVSIMRLLIIIFRGFKGVCKGMYVSLMLLVSRYHHLYHADENICIGPSASQRVWEIPVTGSRLWAFILARYVPLPPKMAQVTSLPHTFNRSTKYFVLPEAQFLDDRVSRDRYRIVRTRCGDFGLWGFGCFPFFLFVLVFPFGFCFFSLYLTSPAGKFAFV
jgi:hypothetical protein